MNETRTYYKIAERVLGNHLGIADKLLIKKNIFDRTFYDTEVAQESRIHFNRFGYDNKHLQTKNNNSKKLLKARYKEEKDHWKRS